jgi:hypothetical protein
MSQKKSNYNLFETSAKNITRIYSCLSIYAPLFSFV